MSSPGLVRINGIHVNLRVEGEGPPVMLLHGFPDSLQLWRHVTPLLVRAGYSVICYDQRGFGNSDAPEVESAYRMDLIAQDAIAILSYLGITEKVKLVGHDWGAFIGWYLCLEHPEVFDRYVAVSVGHPLAYRNAGLEQKLRGLYILIWQLRGIAESLIRSNNWAALRRLATNPEDAQNWIANLSRPGRLTAALNWYRANFFQLLTKQFGQCRVPTCGIYSTNDVALTADQMKGSRDFMQAEWKYVEIENCSHWIPLDKPSELASSILEWFNQR